MNKHIFQTLLLTAICMSGTAAAATFQVNTTRDEPDFDPGDGVCSWIDLGGVVTSNEVCTLRAAIMEANALQGTVHEIVLEEGEIYRIEAEPGPDSFATGDFDIRWPVTIRGEGDGAVVSGEDLDRVFDVRAPGHFQTRFENLTIRKGQASTNIGAGYGAVGGAMYVAGPGVVPHPDVVLEDVRLGGNHASEGGAIYNRTQNQLLLERVTAFDNSASTQGSAIYNEGEVGLSRTGIFNSFMTGAPAIGQAVVFSDGGSVAGINLLIGKSDSSGLYSSNGSVVLDLSTIGRHDHYGLIAYGASADVVVDSSVIAENLFSCSASGGASLTVSDRTLTDRELGCAEATAVDNVYWASGYGHRPEHYDLMPFSPAIDLAGGNGPDGAGCPIALVSGGDLVGNDRPLDGDGDGIVSCDAGALEYGGEPDDGVRTIGTGASCEFADFNEAAAAATPSRDQLWRAMAGIYTDQSVNLEGVNVVIEGGLNSCAADATLAGNSILETANGTSALVLRGSPVPDSPAVSAFISNLVLRDATSSAINVLGGASGISVDIKEVIFQGNSAERGGAIRANGSNVQVHIVDSQFGGGLSQHENDAVDGGALYCGANAEVLLSSSSDSANRFEGNAASALGGAIYTTDGCRLSITGGIELVGNDAQAGSAVYANSAGTSIAVKSSPDRVVIENNVSSDEGSIIEANAEAEIALSGVAIASNGPGSQLAATQGGYLLIETPAGMSSPSTILATGEARASGALASSGGRVEMRRVSTLADSDHPVFLVQGEDSGLRLVSSTVYGPEGSPGDNNPVFVVQDEALAEILLSTVLGSFVGEEASVFAVTGSSAVDIRGSIIRGEGVPVTSGAGTVTGLCNNLSDELDGLARTFTHDPGFVDPTAVIPNFRLASDSMNLDRCRGEDLSVQLGDVDDLDGRGRAIDLSHIVDRDGPYDIGAYEANHASPFDPDLIFSDGFGD